MPFTSVSPSGHGSGGIFWQILPFGQHVPFTNVSPWGHRRRAMRAEGPERSISVRSAGPVPRAGAAGTLTPENPITMALPDARMPLAPRADAIPVAMTLAASNTAIASMAAAGRRGRDIRRIDGLLSNEQTMFVARSGTAIKGSFRQRAATKVYSRAFSLAA